MPTIRSLLPLLLAAALVAPGLAAAQEPPTGLADLPDLQTTRGLVSACDSNGENGRIFCLGALYGSLLMYGTISALLVNGQPVLHPGARVICPALDINFDTLRSTFVTWSRADDARLNLPANRAMFFALADTYQCSAPIQPPAPPILPPILTPRLAP
ncbi:MAG: hypothetical protein EXQ93_05815 [Alphaproteobacteria bacterium]|nr:hypothetical protein [Alphaproteobacteria bacterium]